MSNIITDPTFAPAREIINAKLRKAMRGEIKLRMGSGGLLPGEEPGIDNRVCIMELTAYVLGYGVIGDSPPCTSGVIRDFMIDINDMDISKRKRAMLKAVIPDIINTAPTRWETKTKRHNRSIPVLVTATTDSRYKEAEEQRRQMVATFTEKVTAGRKDFCGDNVLDIEDVLTSDKLSMKAVLEFVRELADVARFDTENQQTSAT